MKRIGLVTLAMVLALASLGIAYAAWTDEITIQGTVNTGDVDLTVEDYSGTWVYKLEDHGIANVHGWMSQKADLEPENAVELVSFAEASAGATGQADVIVTFDNIFPCQWLLADVLLHYDGSIPSRLFAEAAVDPESDPGLVDNLEVEFKAWKLPGFTNSVEDKASIHEWLIDDNLIDIGQQVHWCDYVLVKMYVHLPQDNTLMDLDGAFKARLIAVQWNKFEEWVSTEWPLLPPLYP